SSGPRRTSSRRSAARTPHERGSGTVVLVPGAPSRGTALFAMPLNRYRSGPLRPDEPVRKELAVSHIARPPATTAVATEHPVATVGRYLVRYALVVVIAWIGALKYTGYEAAAIQPLVAHSPIFSWLYSILSVRDFAAVLGSVELVAALLIAIGPLAPR